MPFKEGQIVVKDGKKYRVRLDGKGKISGKQAQDLGKGAEEYKDKRGFLEKTVGGLLSAPDALGKVLGDQSGYAASGASKDYKAEFMDQGEFDKIKDNPLKNLGYTGRKAGGTAALLIGASSGIPGAIAAGALSGLSQGGVDTTAGEMFSNTLKGGAMGGATGAVFKGVGLFGKGLRKVGQRADDVAVSAAPTGKYSGNPNTLIDEFSASVNSKAPTGQNALQRRGVQGQYKQLGLTTNKGDLNFVQGVDNTANTLESSLKFFDLPRNAKGISQLPEKVGAVRDQVLTKHGKNFATNLDSIVDDAGIDEIVRNAARPITKEQAKAGVIAQFQKSLPLEELKGLSPDQFIQGKYNLSAPVIQEIKSSTTKAYLKLIGGKGQMSADELAQAKIYQWADQQLGSIKGYKPVQEVFERLYGQNDGFRRAYDTGLKGVQIASPQDAVAVVANKVGNQISKAEEMVGNVAAGGIPKTIARTAGKAGNQVAKFQSYLEKTGLTKTQAATLAAQNAFLAFQDEDGNGVADFEEGKIPTEGSNGMGKSVLQKSGMQTQEMRKKLVDELMKQTDNKGKRVYKDVSTAMKEADAILSLNGIDTEDAKPAKPKSASDRKLASFANGGLRSIDAIERIIKEDNSARYKTKLPGLLKGSNARQLERAIDNVADAIGRIRSGGAINKEEAKAFKAQLPNMTDDPASIRSSLEEVRQELQDVL